MWTKWKLIFILRWQIRVLLLTVTISRWSRPIPQWRQNTDNDRWLKPKVPVFVINTTYCYWYYCGYTRYVLIIHWYLKTIRNNLRIKCRFLNSWELSDSIYILLVAITYVYQQMIKMFPCNYYGRIIQWLPQSQQQNT